MRAARTLDGPGSVAARCRLRWLGALASFGLVAAMTPFGGLGAPAAAHPLPHAEAPRIVNPAPVPGDVVAAGTVRISALVAAGQALANHELRVNGEVVPASASGGDHPVVSASVTLPVGDHTVELVAANGAGQASRRWRFSTSGLGVGRLSGRERVETAVAVSRDLFPDGASAPAALLARADAFPDALSGVPLARQVGGPLLLSASDRLSPVTAAELTRVLEAGATVYLLGGRAALGDGVHGDVAALGLRPERVSGENRYATAARVAELLPETTTAVVASGETFADALAVSSPAAANGYPILLTRPGELPDATRGVLAGRGYDTVHVVGGEAAVSGGVAAELGRLTGQVVRTAGATRFDTAAAVGRRFFSAADTVAVANGERFPDALSGGVHAAARAAPVLLVASDRLFNPQVVQVGDARPQRAVVYGGGAAVGDLVVAELRRAVLDGGGPLMLRMAPSGGEVGTLDQVVVEFDRAVDPAASGLHVSLGGDEVAGTLTSGEFPNELVFTVADLPAGLVSGASYAGRIVVAARDPAATRRLERRFTYRQAPATLARDDRGAEVAELQHRLRANGYWIGAVDAVYGSLTHQAVLALQKVHGLPLTGVYDRDTRALLESGPPRPAARSTPGSGLVYEIDLVRQVLMRVVDGRVEWIFNTSTGHGQIYRFSGATYRATTTTGRHRITRQIDGLRQAARGTLWRPKYYDTTRGIAIHGSTSVPEYPASSGCIRLTYQAMDFLWSLDPGTGAGVWVYPEDHYG